MCLFSISQTKSTLILDIKPNLDQVDVELCVWTVGMLLKLDYKSTVWFNKKIVSFVISQVMVQLIVKAGNNCMRRRSWTCSTHQPITWYWWCFSTTYPVSWKTIQQFLINFSFHFLHHPGRILEPVCQYTIEAK